MSGTLVLFLLLVFLAIFLLVQGLVVQTFGEGGRTRKLLKQRLAAIESESGQGGFKSLLRQKYLDDLTPLQRTLERLPGMERLRQWIEQAGRNTPAHQVVLLSLVLGSAATMVVLLARQGVLFALLAGGVGLVSPLVVLMMQRQARLEQIERELPDAIDVIKRALRAGHPFNSAIKLVGDDMEGPVAREFETTAADMNYGNDARRAMLGLLSRVPSVALMGFVTAVLVQRETGGNLAEILDQISGVIRGRYRFQRKVRTLSAEGRMSAWVLTMVPIVLAGVLHLTSPKYLPVLFEDPRGQTILAGAAGMMVLGVLWMRKIIRIEV
jgi:tight adherence protein B